MCINLELKSGSFSFVFKTWLFSDIYYCWHQVRCERETYETRGTDWVSCPVSQSIHHLWLCFSRIVFCICVCLSNNPPPPTLFCFVLVSCPVSQSIHQSTTSGFVFLVFVFVSISVSRIPINPPPAALFISVFGFQYLPVSQSSTNIYHRCQTKKEFAWSWHYEF